jgi:hypothetical protein
MKPTLIFFTVLSFYAPNTDAINIFKYLLCGGRSDAYKTQKILPVNFDTDQGTPNSSPMSSESISIDHWDSKKQGSEQVKLKHEEQEQDQDQDDDLKIKSVLKKKKKNKHHRKKAILPISEPFYEFSDIEPLEDTPKKPKPSKTVLGENAKKIRDLLGPNGVCINLKNLSEESARELLKIKRHMENVLIYDNRSDLIILRLISRLKKAKYLKSMKFDIEEDYSDDKNLEYLGAMDEKLRTVQNLNEFLKIVFDFYKDFGFDEILSDCIKVILDSGVITLDMLLDWFDMPLDQIFQMACTKRLDDLAKKIVLDEETASKINLYEGLVKVFGEGNKELLYELLDIVGKRYGMSVGSVYNEVCWNLSLDMDEFEEYKSKFLTK